jgi:hypothetical protein
MALRYVVTANRVQDGAVVYLAVDRTWALGLAQSYRSESEAERDALLAWAKTQERDICDPYALEVEDDGSNVVTPSARERIRSEGPEAVLARLGYAGLPRPGLHARVERTREKQSA